MSASRRERVAYMPELWAGSYGQSYEESKIPIVETFEGMPDGYVKITLPHLPTKKSTIEATEQDNSNEKDKKSANDRTE